MPRPDPDELPAWDDGTVAVLSTGAGHPHAIPVSTGIRVDGRRVLVGLARRRHSLARLKEDPRVALTLLTAGDVAITAEARAEVVQEPMEAAERMAAVLLSVERIQDHGQPRFAIDAGVRWHWTEEDARERDAEIRAALRELARGL